MKRLAFLVLAFGLTVGVPAALAQEARESGKTEAKGEESKASEEEHLKPWKWANFILLAGGLGYLAGKNGGPFFSSRSKQIRLDMTEALTLRKQAEARVAEVEARLANLQSEIAALREESRIEADAEMERVKRQSAAEAAKIQAHAEQEIASAAKAARAELKGYAAQLAVELAEGKIRARMTPAAQNTLVESFVKDLSPSGSKAREN